MSNLTDFFPSGGGGGLTPKFEEFNASGTFTPSQALIDAGGYIEVFLVGAGGISSSATTGANGGEVLMKNMYLTSVSGCVVTIAAGLTAAGTGGDSSFIGSSAGGVDITAIGGSQGYAQNEKMGSGWGSYFSTGADIGMAAGSGTLGYGAGSSGNLYYGGIYIGKDNSGQAGSTNSGKSGSGYCLIKWYE